MKKFLYIMPAVLVCMLYALLATLVGGIGDFGCIAYIYLSLPILAGVLMRKGKWWGCLFGMAMGALLLFNGMTAVGIAVGAAAMVYYTVMGLVCRISQKKA